MRTPLQKRRSRARATALLAVSALLAPSSTSASFLSSSLDSLRARALLPRQVAAGTPGSNSTSSASSTSPVVVNATSHQGRYGHSAVYLPPPTNQLLILGGQLDSSNSSTTSSTPEITSSALKFNLASTFLWGDRPVSAIPDNPSVDAFLSAGLAASAWAAATVDALDQPWLIGGLTADCTTDPTVSLFSNSSWSAPAFEPRFPPRRRQASAVSVLNTTTGGTDIWVLGGIAEQYTCATDGATVGYVGLDRYDTVSGVVESMAWAAPAGAEAGWAAPVSDYSATVSEDGQSIVVVGGQTATGTLADTSQVLVFDVTNRSWTAETLTGDIPSSRMGHVAVPLSSGSLLLHGGVSSTHTPLSDLLLLTPSSSGWSSTLLEISSSSESAPALAYHTATLVAGETIVVAFGIDASAAPSSNFWFLTVDEAAGTYTWKDTFDGNQEAVDALAAASSTTTTASRLAKKALEVVVNPKADKLDDDASSTAAAAETGAYYGNGAGEQAPAAYSTAHLSPSLSSHIVVAAPSSTASSAAKQNTSSADSDSDSGSSKKTTAIAASLGTIGGAVALLGLGFLLLRRRAAAQSAQFAAPQSPAMGFSGGAAPVSTLLYTRPAQGRNLSLGSTISPVPSRLDEGDDGSIREVLYDQDAAAAASSAVAQQAGDGNGLGSSADPFADDYRVNELGQLERANSGASSTGGVVGALASSLPFLSSSAASSKTAGGGDVYTSPAPTLTAKRSLRRPGGSQALPPLPSASPVPPTPAELIGLAVTSDDGHALAPASADVEGLPYLQPAGQSWDPASASAAKSPVPRSLTPGGSSLRVANPDPFVDQPQA